METSLSPIANNQLHGLIDITYRIQIFTVVAANKEEDILTDKPW